ncbi:MAG: efflux RND transporter permease subunit [Elusimicrobia bacterium]|nr:efflux RND transporter permease subunit [Elusimicrobiota bacterium]
MSLPRTAVGRPVTTLMLYAALCFFGVFAFIVLPVDLMPNAGAGSLTVMIGVRGGLPPEDIETLVTKVVEEAVATAAHLRNVLSVSRKDRSVVTLTYEPGTDLSFAALEIQERLAKIKNKLPRDIEKPIVAHYSEGDYPVLILSLTSDKLSPEKMREIVDNRLKPQLSRVNGVANVEVGGGRERKILVEFYQDRLEAYRLSIRQVIDAIGKNNVNLLSGKTLTSRDEWVVRTMGQYGTMEELKQLVVLQSAEGSSIRLSDIADIRDFYLEAESYARLNKKPTVSVYIQKDNNSNTIRVVKRARDMIAKFEKTQLDPSIRLQIVTDQSTFIQEAMSNVTQNFTWGAILTWGIIFLFLKEWKHTTVVFLSVPIAVLITLGFMYLAGLSLNVMTLTALALGIGMVVDSATVVLENILEKKKHLLRIHPGSDLTECTIQGTEELFISLVGSTLTTVVVFLPIVFINKQVKILYSGLAFTITVSMAAALVVAVTLVPLLASRIQLPSHKGYLSPGGRARLDRFWAATLRFTPAWVFRWAAHGGGWRSRIFPSEIPEKYWTPPPDYVPVEESPPVSAPVPAPEDGSLPASDPAPAAWGIRAWVKYYWHAWFWPSALFEIRRARHHPRRAFVHWCAQSVRQQKWISLGMGAAALLSVFVYLFVMEKDFLGTTEQNEFIIYIELPAGAKLDISDQVVREVEQKLSDTPEIAEVVKTAAARVEGWSSKVYVTLAPRSERSRSVQDVINEIRPKVADIGQQFDSFIYFSEPESSKEFFIDVFGPDYNELRDMASAIAGKLQNVRGLTDIKLRYKPGQPELQIKVNKDRAALFGLTVKDIAEDLHAQIRGLRPTFFFEEGNQLEIIGRDKEIYRKTVEDIGHLSVAGPEGDPINISQITDFGYALTPSEVWRKDKQRVIQVSANREKLALSSAAKRSLSALRGLSVKPGYYFQIGGDYVDMVQNEREFRFAFLIMAALVFIVLASLFESYTQALIVMVTIPMALIGSIPLLHFTHTPATMSVYIGIIMLGGIVVSAAIILVERINQSRQEGRELKRAVLESSWIRLSPILNTSLTTIVDLVPMALSRSDSAALWAPLSLTVIGGATVSTFLTLFYGSGDLLPHGNIQTES